jgi:hypothetical protein
MTKLRSKPRRVDDWIRHAAETIYQALIEAELTAVIGEHPHQCAPAGSTTFSGLSAAPGGAPIGALLGFSQLAR